MVVGGTWVSDTLWDCVLYFMAFCTKSTRGGIHDILSDSMSVVVAGSLRLAVGCSSLAESLAEIGSIVCLLLRVMFTPYLGDSNSYNAQGSHWHP
jgi:hypothetical protein